MPQYEIGIILNPNLDGAQAALEKDVIKAALERHGASIKNVDDWGNRRLAYPIQKDPEGNVVFYTVEMAGNNNAALERELRLRDHVRRVTIIRDRPEWRNSQKKK
ncbi:30S ribosomal protein S6 [Meiothermus ruber]|jgi:small subunit ribosomal protein S6|uniref:Small ribosomal subunit protein bS6 n=1 Tax=Meiothermus ruber (strain ATCC 35948 / DSM 1279 / VKM B-1258 / 21) TaxID=504728 RepID=D3PSV5_MEIRD|nr:30S ribosomal protein S6 [Meiothermus ruber]ADD28538.1 ribosomal protein S6 [Meiothermus ruber DSM 1279]AGK06019.1 30S ribosomal protein S6 [Meiothermus ruber DSM 1279]MCL6530745.1 30S ribosomal protein S6 [Meiothermus ruber]GAO75499.1 30S ribosomal protein S6 [Meiothermus ruber H328]